jgi:hypothetical protein
MRQIGIRLTVSSVLSCAAFVAVAVAAGAPPVPPVKPGLWEARMTTLDADGHETIPPEQAALAKMPPEVKAKMAEAMKARGMSIPDANGATKVCFTKDMFESGRWQQMAADSGCTTNFSTQSSTLWKWHSTCTSLNSESDGEAVFSSPESYKTRMTTTATVGGKTKTTTRIVQSKWLAADCGDIKPFTPPARK